MLVYVFPGQGSQHLGMGKEIFDEFKQLTEIADSILGYSIKDLCINDPHKLLDKTNYTQPALYIVNALSYFKRIKDNNQMPSFLAGHSLGEYNALLAAGAMDFETGLRLVIKRGELMAQESDGGMAAIVGLSEEIVKELLSENKSLNIDIANYNTPSQLVIAGKKEDIYKAEVIFKQAGAFSYTALNVSGAFHSRYMLKSSRLFSEFLNGFTFSNIKIPVIANINARPYKQCDIKDNLVKQITHSVKWIDTIRFFMGKGDVNIIQIGPGNTLNRIVKAIMRDADPLVLTEEEYIKYVAN
ncbi:ACP S-malonyltransferase [Alkaliphilus pronyensis]|uniref:Malonyl CoA-acyl carrier protein transacylase n=1 Tax=Alkaliphilus pronyensis TaxID=1482732 RepID=A0A6I0F9R8_9FIRM|nr:ACP S-malonyltransferase [Alkaliphilus pronyensis]KAB3533486.1 ACP S-malonyltransferase [Alkaliphilus pronyensis]